MLTLSGAETGIFLDNFVHATAVVDSAPSTWAHFLSLARSKLGLCSANHRAGYFSNLACDWLGIA